MNKIIVPILARLVSEGDVLTDAEGMYRRTVTDVDLFSNVHGKIILRAGSQSTIVNPDTIVHILV